MNTVDIEEGTGTSPQAGSDRPNKKPLADIAEQTAVEKAAAVLAFISLVTSVLALVMVGGIYVRIASILSFLLAPYSYFQQTRITDINALKETYNAMTHEVDTLKEQNDRLETEVKDLNMAVGKLENIQDALDMLTESETKSVQSLLETVEDNKMILAQMEKNLKSAVLQNIISILIGSDKDMNFMLDEEETTDLINRLTEIEGISVDEPKFRKIVRDENGSLDGIMGIIKDVLYNEEMEDPVIKFDS